MSNKQVVEKKDIEPRQPEVPNLNNISDKAKHELIKRYVEKNGYLDGGVYKIPTSKLIELIKNYEW
jgi:hypothetical protein